MPAFLSKSEAISAIRSAGVEDAFLKAAGLNSLDELDPANFEGYDSFRQYLTVKSDTTAPSAPSKPASKEDADARPPKVDESSSSILLPFLTTGIVRHNQLRPSYFFPSSFFMYYILHQMNEVLCDNFYFKRYCPDYHPYVLRLYYGIVFIVQVLRAQKTVVSLPAATHQFLVRFLEAFDPSSLPIAGPLIPLFKSICSSQPELSNLGLVYPRLPSPLGPASANSGFHNGHGNIQMPHITGIFSLLEHLNEVINATNPVYPKKNWTPFLGKNTTVKFAHVDYPVERAAGGTTAAPTAAVEWNDGQAWMLTFPGIEYSCEASKSLNESFSERYDNFDFPTIADTTNLSEVSDYLRMTSDDSWFSLVKSVAAKAAAYTNGSGTLADCSPTGLKANQTVVLIQAPDTLPTKPTFAEAKKATYTTASNLTFGYRLSTTSRNPDQLAETMSAFAQTHIRVYQTHPYPEITQIGTSAAGNKVGSFWSLRPIFYSPTDDSAYLSIREYVDKATKQKL